MLTSSLLAHEPAIRLTAFFFAFAAMATWEVLAPRRVPALPRARRWTNNLALLLINSVLVRLLFPAAAVGFAAFAESHSMGLLQTWEIPQTLAIVASLALLDVGIYLQHRLFHALPLLWRLHCVHHADLDFDATTGTRFHPIEIALSMGIKFLVIVTLGPPVLAVLMFETLLNVTALFNHSNIRLPLKLDGAFRRWLVTPDMHRIHHSIDRAEMNSNFGFCFSLWDRVLGTYTHVPKLGHIAMTIGIPEQPDPASVVNLSGLLAMPFRHMARLSLSSSHELVDRAPHEVGERDGKH